MPHNHLREMTEEDLDLILEWRNHPDVNRYLFTRHEISPEEHAAWFRKNANDPHSHLLVFISGDEPRGVATLSQINKSGVADWGFYTSPTAPRGTGTQLGHLVIEHAFSHLELHKLCGQVMASNEASIRFHLKMGFREEGILRDQFFDGKTYHPVICFGLLETDLSSDQG